MTDVVSSTQTDALDFWLADLTGGETSRTPATGSPSPSTDEPVD